MEKNKKKKVNKMETDVIRNEGSAAVAVDPTGDMTEGAVLTGRILRAVIAFLGVFSLTLFICDAFDIVHLEGELKNYRVPEIAVALSSLIFVAIMFFSSLNRITKIAVPIGSAGIFVGICAIVSGDPFSFIYDSVRYVYNFSLRHMANEGFTSVSGLMFGDSYGSDKEYLLLFGMVILSALISILMYFFVFKKVRLIAVSVCVVAIVLPLSEYNLMQTNMPFAFVVVFVCAALAMWVYDYTYDGGLSKKENRNISRSEKTAMRKQARKDRYEARMALDRRADMIFKAAMNADLGPRIARMAKNAVYKKDASDKKNKKYAEKEAEKERKRKLREDEKTERIKERQDRKKLSPSQKKAERKNRSVQKKENRKTKDRTKQARTTRMSAGGFAGIAAALIALIAIIIPSSSTESNFVKIPFIYNKVEYVNAYVTDQLLGDDIDLNSENIYKSDSGMYSRTLSFKEMVYEGLQIFKVEVPSDSSVYMRAWVGSDYTDNTWYSADTDEVIDYRQRFGTGFTPDSITTDFNRYAFEGSVYNTAGTDSYNDYRLYGFITENVDVYRLGSGADVLMVPSYMDTDTGVMKYDTTKEANFRYTSYYDGIYSCRMNTPGTGYSTVSFVRDYTNEDGLANIDKSSEYMDISEKYIDRYDAGEDLEELETEYQAELGSKDITYTGTDLLTRYSEMTQEEKDGFADYRDTEDDYSDFALDTYTGTSGDEEISALADEIFSTVGEDGTKTENIQAVIDWLGENCTYTLDPYVGSGVEYTDILNAFLFDEKQGYCQHFATAAAMLLREKGYAVRYCEGYVATGFEKDYYANAISDYRDIVLDSDAHAWIEVYFDNIGWVNFEVTPGFTDSVYSTASTDTEESGSSSENAVEIEEAESNATEETAPETSENSDRDVTDTDEGLASDWEVFLLIIRILLILAAVIAVIAIIWNIIKKKGDKVVRERYKLIGDAKDEKVYSYYRTDHREMANKLDDDILTILKEIGAGPKKGELITEYGKRLDTDFKGLSRTDASSVMAVIEKNEFGGILTLGEMTILSDYLGDMITVVYSGLSPIDKFKLRYIKRII